MSDTSPAHSATEQESNQRYSRHLLLPEVGQAGQRKLANSSVALVGVGGLGSPAALYLAAAGVGRLTLIDPDTVDLSNLQRQVLYATAEVGQPKAEKAAARLQQLNPHIQVQAQAVCVTAANASRLLADHDIIIDGSDNFSTRYLVNDACLLLNRPLVHASIFRFEGQLSLFVPGSQNPCYRCLHPQAPPAHLAPNCAQAGVLGVLPGVLGTLQANEAIKCLLGLGENLVGRLLQVNLLSLEFWSMKIRKQTRCLCQDPAAIVLQDQPQACLGGLQIEAVQFRERYAQGWRPLLLDVREPHEWATHNLQEFQAQLSPLGNLATIREQFPQLEPNSEIVVQCQSGGRSQRAQHQLLHLGFNKVYNLTGGLEEWNRSLRQK